MLDMAIHPLDRDVHSLANGAVGKVCRRHDRSFVADGVVADTKVASASSSSSSSAAAAAAAAAANVIDFNLEAVASATARGAVLKVTVFALNKNRRTLFAAEGFFFRNT